MDVTFAIWATVSSGADVAVAGAEVAREAVGERMKVVLVSSEACSCIVLETSTVYVDGVVVCLIVYDPCGTLDIVIVPEPPSVSDELPVPVDGSGVIEYTAPPTLAELVFSVSIVIVEVVTAVAVNLVVTPVTAAFP